MNVKDATWTQQKHAPIFSLCTSHLVPTSSMRRPWDISSIYSHHQHCVEFITNRVLQPGHVRITRYIEGSGPLLKLKGFFYHFCKRLQISWSTISVYVCILFRLYEVSVLPPPPLFFSKSFLLRSSSCFCSSFFPIRSPLPFLIPTRYAGVSHYV